jgi:hypothetical protein
VYDDRLRIWAYDVSHSCILDYRMIGKPTQDMI